MDPPSGHATLDERTVVRSLRVIVIDGPSPATSLRRLRLRARPWRGRARIGTVEVTDQPQWLREVRGGSVRRAVCELA
jgi:hypothetical protein